MLIIFVSLLPALITFIKAKFFAGPSGAGRETV